MMIEIYMLIFIAWITGAMASYAVLHDQRWTHPRWYERLVLSILWPANVAYVSYHILKWIIKRERGE
jgi:hypothetical protein